MFIELTDYESDTKITFNANHIMAYEMCKDDKRNALIHTIDGSGTRIDESYEQVKQMIIHVTGKEI